MNRALEVHFRLSTTLPSRVHHAKEPAESTKTNGYMPLTPAAKIERAAELEAQGVPRGIVSKTVGVSMPTLMKYLGRVRAKSI